MSAATEYKRGLRDGVIDAVKIDRERLAFASALLIAELIHIAKGGDHECRPESIGVAMETKMPRADGRCCECAIVATLKELGVAEYKQVMDNLRGMNGVDL